jgi:AcrR family transcriptional regulator
LSPKRAPKRRTQRERREATIKKLIEATIESLLTVGYRKTTVKEICTRSGISHGGLFRFFPSMLDLVLAAAEEVAARQIEQFERRFSRAVRAKDPVDSAVRLVRDACRSPIDIVFFELLVAARTDAKLRRALKAPMERYHAAIRQAALMVPGMAAMPAEVREVLLFTVIHIFEGESLTRAVLTRPHVEARRIELVVDLISLARTMSE